MFSFVKQIFVSILMIFGNLSNVNSLERVSINNQDCRVRPEIVNFNSNDPLVLEQLNVVVVAIISMIHMQNCVFLM